MARFQPGNRDQEKRKTRGGGRPTKEQAEEKKLQAEKARDVIERNAEKLANKLIKDAMTAKGRRSLHVAINKLIPDAKQTIALETDGMLEQAIRRIREKKSGRNG